MEMGSKSEAPAATAADASLVVACASCGKKNRVARDRLDQARCGSCKQPVLPDHPVTGGDATWQRDVDQAPVPVLVDFWAPWCGPCRAVAPALDKIARERQGRVKIVKVNVDENPATASRFGIQSIPTMMVFRDGQVQDRVAGALPKAAIDARLDKLLG
jgi:thioredoxin 2